VQDHDILPEQPIRQVGEGAAKGIDLLIGTTRDEIKLLAPVKRAPIDDAALIEGVCTVLETPDLAVARSLIDVYRTSRRGLNLPTGNLDMLDAINTDVHFRIPALRIADAQSAAGCKAYVYLFTHESSARRGALGACHALELAFVFGSFDAPTQDRFCGTGPDVDRLSGEMMDCWIAFARTGNPATPAVAPWQPYGGSERPTMMFGTSRSGQENDPFGSERRAVSALM
jgi:para-nitrobenzyl esterase